MASYQPIKEIPEANHFHYTIDDNDEEETMLKMDQILLETSLFLYEHLKNGRNVLVHCRAGISRSATVVLDFLCKYNNWKLVKAYGQLQNCRMCINPSFGFYELLKHKYG